jgi:thioredoxin reductase
MTYDLVIIGAGISGLTAALSLAQKGVEQVLIVEHQKQPGGFASLYFDSPEFAPEREILQRAAALPYEIRTETTIAGFFPGEPHQLYVQSPDGAYMVEAKRILIAAGSLEKPREANRIPGTRPAGVMTPMLAMQLLERGYLPGRQVVLMENGRIAKGAARILEREIGPITCCSADEWELAMIRGTARLESVQMVHKQDQSVQEIECDTLVYAKGRIPNTFFLKGTPVLRDHEGSVIIEETGKTNVPHVFATGSCTCRGDEHHSNSIDLAHEVAAHLFA